MDKSNKYFYLEKVFPNSIEILSSSYKGINEIKNDCLFILDTNVLLFPYKTSTQSLKDLEVIYSRLINNNRLLIPARVIREFGNNRGKNLAEIYKRLKQKENSMDKIETKIDFYPILEKEKEYVQLQKVEKDLKELVGKSREAIRNLQFKVSNYNWNDPVSELYKKLFTGSIIKEVQKTQDDLIDDLNFRIEHKIAPGYNDSSKSDKGIGDLIIWQTILEIGKDLKKNIIFVTDDSKNDWFYIEEKKTIYPKFELFDEFRRYTQNTIHIVDITTFLELQNASEETIKEVIQNKILLTDYSNQTWNDLSHLEVHTGMTVNYASKHDNHKFHNHNSGFVLAVEPNETYENIIVLQKPNMIEKEKVAGKNFKWRVMVTD
jgi:rRNA-processing protein FCF1